MPLDPNIILQAGRGVTPLQDPSEMQARLQQSQLGALQLQQARQGVADDQTYRQTLMNTPADQLPGALYKAGLGKQGNEAAKFQTEQQKTQAERGKLVADGMKSGAAMILANPTEENAIQTLTMAQQQYGLPPQMVDNAKSQIYAARNDPNKLRQLAQGWGGDAEKVLGKFTTENLGGTMQTQRVNPITGQVDIASSQAKTASPDSMLSAQTSTANNAATIANSSANAQLADQRAREFNATRVEENRLKAAAAPKMTEDQGKATGWLVQAENAFKNMQAAGFDEKGNPKSAAYPGPNDALAGVPGMSGVANSMRSTDRQKFIQASSSLSESLLRAATGAGVNESEAKQKIQELTPQFGENKETTKQKMEAIPLYIESLKVRAGPGANKADEIAGNRNTPKAARPSSKTINIGGNEMRAELAPDGNYYVQQNGRWSRVKE